jgi:hypothetical protein
MRDSRALVSWEYGSRASTPDGIDRKIAMGHNIPEDHDVVSRDRTIGTVEFERDTLGRFTEHSTLKQHGVLARISHESS